jgi:hypothetical protein
MATKKERVTGVLGNKERKMGIDKGENFVTGR